jgi:hemerythrin
VADANKRAHQAFLGSVADLAAEFARTGPTKMLAFKLEGAMATWLKTHIVNTDTKMGPCVPAGVRM